MDGLCFKFGCTGKAASSDVVSSMEETTSSLCLNLGVRHIAQLTENDCGLACFKMVLRHYRRRDGDELERRLDGVIQSLDITGKSLWTIDIAHLCALMGLEHQMYTKTFGVEETYAQEDFYAKDNIFESEKARVNDKFQNAARHGIKVKLEHVELSFIRNELKTRRCPCIVLIDASLLNGVNLTISEDNEAAFKETLLKKASSSSRSAAASPATSSPSARGYLGHFIVLIGFDDERQIFIYRNPSSDFNVSFTSYENLEKARTSFGTDEDILFVYGPSHGHR